MSTLQLSDEEAATLRDALKSYLSDLHTEISHTDNREFREQLKGVQARLQEVLRRLEAEAG